MSIRNICCIGAGYVGGPTMAVIAHECPEIKVTVIDNNIQKIKAWNSSNLNNLPVYEPGLSKIIEVTRNRNLFFSSDFENAISESEMIFMAVNTPTKTKGIGKGYAADLSNIEQCAKIIGQVSKTNKIVVEKSTLPVRTAEKIKEVLSHYSKNNVTFEVISNPEFLAEGTAIKNLYKSDRVLIGGDNSPSGNKAVQSLLNIYNRWIPRHKILKMKLWSAELSKLASNAMLAQRISSINSLSALCEKSGASIKELSKAIGTDKRIGPHFLEASVGFGGSCFKKDLLNLVYLCRTYGLNEVAEYWNQVILINEYQKNRFLKKVLDLFNFNIINTKISVLGWAYKKETNDSRESASIYVATKLLEQGAIINIYDPMVPKEKIILDLKLLIEDRGNSKEKLKKILANIKISSNIERCISKSEAVLVLTEWDEFKNFDWDYLFNNLENPPFVIDGRNIIRMNKKNNNKLYSIGK